MSINPFSLFGLVAALDSRYIQGPPHRQCRGLHGLRHSLQPENLPPSRAVEITHATRRLSDTAVARVGIPSSGIEGCGDLAGHLGQGGAGLALMGPRGGVDGDEDGAAEVVGLGRILLR